MAKKTNKKNKEVSVSKKGRGLIFKKLVYFLVVLNLLNIAFIFIFRKSIPPEAPLFYGLAEGSDQLTTTYGLIIPSAFSLVVIGINAILSYVTENRFLKETLMIASLVVTLFSTITTYKIIFLVGSF